jgi:hypothetical protein
LRPDHVVSIGAGVDLIDPAGRDPGSFAGGEPGAASVLDLVGHWHPRLLSTVAQAGRLGEFYKHSSRRASSPPVVSCADNRVEGQAGLP